MRPARRALLAAGAGGAIVAATGTTRAAPVAPSLAGPYLDLRTPAGNVLATARIHGDLAPGTQKYFWIKGVASAIRPGHALVDILGVQGFGAVRVLPRADGSWERLCREVIYYTDLATGAVLEHWDNPFTGERVRVVHSANDPINFLLQESFPVRHRPDAPPGAAPPRVPFLLNWQQQGDWLDMETHVHLAGPNPLQPDRWPRESSGPVTFGSEYFSHHVRLSDLQDERLTAVDYRGSWHRVSPWLPWMLMGQAPGEVYCVAHMGSTRRLEEIFPAATLDHARRHHERFFAAPERWTDEPSLPGLEQYARTQQPAPPRAPSAAPAAP